MIGKARPKAFEFVQYDGTNFDAVQELGGSAVQEHPAGIQLDRKCVGVWNGDETVLLWPGWYLMKIGRRLDTTDEGDFKAKYEVLP